MTETSGQESGYFPESGTGVNQDPSWCEFATNLLQQRNKRMRRASYTIPIIDARQLVDVCSVQCSRWVHEDILSTDTTGRDKTVMVVFCWQLSLFQHIPFQQIVHYTPLSGGAVMPGKQRADARSVQIGVEDGHAVANTGELQRGGRKRR